MLLRCWGKSHPSPTIHSDRPPGSRFNSLQFSVDSQTNNMNNCGLLTCSQYIAEFASVIRQGTDKMAQTDCCVRKMLKYKVVNPQLHSYWSITGTFRHFACIMYYFFQNSEHSSASQYSNDTKNIKVSLLCLLTSPRPLPMSGYLNIKLMT